MEENEINETVEKEFEVELTAEQETEINEKVKALKEKNPKLRIIFPIAVQGDPDYDDKELYVGYFCQPNFKTFSKYLTFLQKDQAGALRQLAKDCFLDGDKELIDDDSLFMFGLMGQLGKITSARNSRLINLSKTGK